MKPAAALIIFASGVLIGAFVLWLGWEFVVDWKVSMADKHYDFPFVKPPPRGPGGPPPRSKEPMRDAPVFEDDGVSDIAAVIDFSSRQRRAS
jgi:hypothetical protein